MGRVLTAVYEKGVFRPLQPVNLEEGARVELQIESVSPGGASPWREFLDNLEPLTDEQFEILKREAQRRPLFGEREE